MKRRPDFLVFFATITLLGIGIVMVFSASNVAATAEFNDGFYYLKRQVVAAAIGLISMCFFMRIEYRRLKSWGWAALIVAIALLGLVLMDKMGVEGGGATRWLQLGPFHLQPSEVAKVSIVLFLATILSDNKKKITDFWQGLLPLAGVLAALFLLILKQPDLGTAVTLAATAVTMLYIAGAKRSHLFVLGILAAPGVWWAVVGKEYRLRRFLAFLNPEADPLDAGFHIMQSLYAIGSGGLLGVGLGQSRQKFFYLPERHTDFIFAIIGEELGLLGTLAVLSLFMLLAWRGCRAAMLAPDRFGTLLGTGIVAMVCIQALVNMGVVTGSLPITGIPLPFVSYGGSSLVFSLAAMGILLNISRRGGSPG
ncbi:MAG TPA: putative lipid II flippase FtsW [bacterium]|jgi:cell division protein FtsW|nr:putative lipid II flippase FtsW [bacterium]